MRCLLRPALWRSVTPVTEPLEDAVSEFGRHLRAERDVSPHTLRAYLGDLADLCAYAAVTGVTEPAGLDVSLLRAWLARQHAMGRSRATLARRTAAVRAFTRHLHRRGLLEDDPGLLLGTPKRRRDLPDVLTQDDAARLLDTLDVQGPLGLRDLAVLEVLYGTGVESANCADSTSTTSTPAAGRSASSARADVSAQSLSANPPSVPSRTGCAPDAPRSRPRTAAPPSSSAPAADVSTRRAPAASSTRGSPR